MTITTELIKEVLDHLRAAWVTTREGEGGYCPVCDRWGKNNPYTMNKALVKNLTVLYQQSVAAKDGWVYLPTYRNHVIHRSHQYGKLAYWGLLVAKPEHSGWWKTTDLAVQFLRAKAKIPTRVWVYNSEVVGVGVREIDITQVFKTHFDLAECMTSTWDYWESIGEIVKK